MKRLTQLIFAAIIVASTPLLAESNSDTTMPIKEHMKANFEAFKTDLNLTPEQDAQMTEALEENAKQRDKTLDKYGISLESDKKARLNIREKIALKKDMDQQRSELQSKLTSILNDEQLDKWNEFQQQTQEEFKKRIEARMR